MKEARVLPINSVLVSCIGYLGKIGMNSRKVAFNQQINAIKPNLKIAIPRFTFYQALSPYFLKQLKQFAGGTTVPIVNKSKFNQIKFLYPSLEEQNRIVDVLDPLSTKTKQLEALYENKLASLKELKQSLLQKAFSGAL